MKQHNVAHNIYVPTRIAPIGIITTFAEQVGVNPKHVANNEHDFRCILGGLPPELISCRYRSTVRKAIKRELRRREILPRL